ncbi:MAG: polysaccharide biosynthesis/export family protein [Bacteroidales bacterium]|nr:polysaccharide biosynthesis/export family protein [Bacteroidales bacterium]
MKTKLWIICSLFGLVIISCTQQKQLVYLQGIDEDADSSFFSKLQPEYRIQKQDILYIKIYTLNQEVSDLINQTSANYQQNLFQNETSLFINGYSVNDSGYVEIPVLGRIPVLNKTIDESVESIRKRAAVYLKDATIIVKLISFKFTVMGEVNRPGVYRNFNNQLTVLEAISMAGDITDYGNRKKILVLRPSKEGTITFRLNLTKKELLTSDGYFLLPNDIVYVQPINSKIFRLNAPTFSFVLSSITTLILVLNFIRISN